MDDSLALEPDGSSASRCVIAHAREALDGRRRGWRTFTPFVGPAVVVSVAYIDPGNIATGIEAGVRYGYQLLWVVLASSLVAMLFQMLSARVGIVTGRNLAQLCRTHLPAPAGLGMWFISELAAMATDLAEFVGAAVGIALLTGIPLLYAMVLAGVLTYLLLMLQVRGFRSVELMIGALVAVIGISYIIQVWILPVSWAAALRQTFVPTALPPDAFMLAAGIVGATVMPHALFLHSGLVNTRVRPRSASETSQLLRYSNREVVAALAAAGCINLAMVVVSAGAFHGAHAEVAGIEDAYITLAPLFGASAGLLFLVGLIASGLSSSVVGTMAGQMVLQGFLRVRLPVGMRRLITMVPAFIVIGAGMDVTQALVLSQVVLSMVVPFPMAALIWLARRPDLMGQHAAGRGLVLVATVGAVLVAGLNGALLVHLIA
ncbi:MULTISPECIES: Nramp family divalent metal transporter [Ralstonia]|jgi:manganese transport protein|uniref:Divalent metal cation transporter MntH n=1 Tax=Ralstonia pickettii OR214 TaxID=1264675 RepID=R0E5A6_RALPI|nr:MULTISPECIES: Nramp family divalent metal transporter [Ralstonia]MEA3268262.1 Nramp family divalent metal transporter [Pseudomonadota bacterium]ENZ77319.1 natural resistance-associated macrophage protein metal ion transporter NRAMP [Ralstonia pickettii OR214]MBL4778566.1 Nramp family divalent metal transporter [Ralstonia sp.]MCM3579724.1 Nramp family divalent metal transporter [Ralstonia pickettii]MDR9385206.1 Nramp family divalent metal transporter [Ralstonia sp. 11b]